MNNLFSPTSLKRYTDLKWQAHVDGMEAMQESVNLDDFFMDVDNIKDDLHTLQQLHLQLHNANQETKTVHSATTMKDLRARMDADVEQVLRKARTVKAKLETLDKANLAHRKLPGCGVGTLADRTRTSVVGGLGTKLKELMGEFQELRTKMAAEYKETVARRYFAVTGEHAGEDVVEGLIARGESERFMQRVVEGKVVMDVVVEMQERHDAVKEMERSLMELQQVFLDMAALVGAQGQQIDDIESNLARADSFVRKGAVELQTAREYQKRSRKWTCMAVGIGLLVISLILVPVITNILKMI
ncbi:hypothetical protein J5N97_006404 [Dioscorea zingiberensis]|uniref:t-SNARE coiled-coil homology domain-containing protein n=1 Tax=Dioscorea zingiberensis TaxID=325984 RepID=A0A9D5DA38_9LILI|nr:hypothetical protein J5N97_006404 [Dioscorea zingiberensis]